MPNYHIIIQTERRTHPERMAQAISSTVQQGEEYVAAASSANTLQKRAGAWATNLGQLAFTIAGVALTFLLSSCAIFDRPFSPEFDRGPNVKIKYVTVETRDEMDIFCGYYGEGKVVLGCARVPAQADGLCIIMTYKNGSKETLKHEEDHCRYGRWHL